MCHYTKKYISLDVVTVAKLLNPIAGLFEDFQRNSEHNSQKARNLKALKHVLIVIFVQTGWHFSGLSPFVRWWDRNTFVPSYKLLHGTAALPLRANRRLTLPSSFGRQSLVHCWIRENASDWSPPPCTWPPQAWRGWIRGSVWNAWMPHPREAPESWPDPHGTLAVCFAGWPVLRPRKPV